MQESDDSEKYMPEEQRCAAVEALQLLALHPTTLQPAMEGKQPRQTGVGDVSDRTALVARIAQRGVDTVPIEVVVEDVEIASTKSEENESRVL